MGTIAPIQNSPPLPPPGKSGGIGEKAENSLLRFVYKMFDGLKNQISDMFRHAVGRTFETLENEANQIANPFYDQLLANGAVPEYAKSVIRSVRSGEHQGGAAAAVAAVVFVIYLAAQALWVPVGRKVEQFSDALVRSNLLGFGVWIEAVRRHPELRGDMIRELQGQGWTDTQVAAAEIAAKQRLGVNDWIALFLKKEVDASTLSERAVASGFDLAELPYLQKLAKQIPGPSDLVRMGVREAFSDAVSGAYGYDSAFPAPLAEWMEKQGFDKQWASYYWRAHWELPSVQMGFEMLHRRLITRDELKNLLRVLDIAPGWIDKLIAMSYNTYTRVDTRRMYASGVINDLEVMQSYLDQGYTADQAAKLARWTMQDAVNEEAGLTRASVQKSYGKRRISRGEAIEMLERLGTSASVADFILEQADLDRADDLLDRQIDTVGKRFKNGQMSESGAFTALGQLGVQGAEVRVLVEEWRASMSATVKRPTKADLERFFDQGVLDMATYRDQLALLGYDVAYIAWYVASLAYESQQSRLAQAEAARKEQDRVEALRKKDAVKIAKSQIDVQIAELNSAIADAQVALVATVNERDSRLRSVLPDGQVAALKLEHAPLLNAADAAIAQSQLKISQLNSLVGQARTRIAEISVAISENRDYALESTLKSERLGLQTDQARMQAESATRRTEIARIKEVLPTLEAEEDAAAYQQRVLALQREIAERSEAVAVLAVEIETIDEQLPAVLGEADRAMLLTEQARLNVSIRENESLADALQTAIRQAQADRLAVEQDLQTDIARLPSRGDQIAIQSKYATMIDQIEARIIGVRAQIRELQVRKSELNL